MNDSSDNQRQSGNRRAVIALASCIFGVGLILLALQMDRDSQDKAGAAAGKPEKQEPKKKPQRAWNIALGNVVVVAPDLGFAARAVNGRHVEESKIAVRLESQLQSLREFYRQESDREPDLMGAMLLQLTVTSSGEVTHIKELGSRIADGEFKKAVLTEVSNWTFPEILTDTTIINCPFLFVREGMDITTLIQWEQTIGQFGDKPILTRSHAPSIPQQTTDVLRRADAGIKTPAAYNKVAHGPELKSPAKLYQIKHPTTIRKEPSFGSPAVAKFTVGTKVTLISGRGDWLEVRADDASPSGFIRKEFVTAVELAQKK
jgi:hypothetical protein